MANPYPSRWLGPGTGRGWSTSPLFEALKPWMKLVAVCDPVRESTDAFAEAAGVPAFYDLAELVRARPMEAALVVTPVPHTTRLPSISCPTAFR